ncbi:uncharacterized protein LOC110443098 [Mizuhopecten yessoensis]|uniref:uncharacterized protein LOC110443098 n=1 Tax=Mizuhopecten yessoensis TaxID=6573 RepID=UPI000B45C14F|nr:uncharacterized protein LOC110443098 [Mizuhopecten yessoensis]
MSDNPDLLSPTEDNSHLSEGTRLRMKRVRDLEQQRLQRVLARSIATAQQPPAVAQQDAAAEPRSPIISSPNLGSRSPNSTRSTGRARYVTVGRMSRSISEDRTVVPRLPLKDEGSENIGQAEDDGTSSRNEASVGATGEVTVFMKKLDELASSAENDDIKQRYLRLKELEETRLHGREGGDRPVRGSVTLGRSASVNEHVSAGRLARRNSDQVRQRHGSPVMSRRLIPNSDDSSETQLSRASSASNLYTPDLSSLDKFFSGRRQESLKRIEELAKCRQHGSRSMSMDMEPGERSTRDRFLESVTAHPSIPRIEPISSILYTRTHEPPIQYPSIDERLETISPRYGSDTSLNRIGIGSFDDFRRGSGDNLTQTTQVYHDPLVPGLTYVDEEGHTQWITPSSPLYKQMKAMDKPPSIDLKLEERKKRSLLAREGLEDHFLTECFDPDISFEERIGLIREKLYGSKVLIPSDKRRAMADRGSPDGASNVVKDCNASGGTDNEGHR